jgi:hypothetical protein
MDIKTVLFGSHRPLDIGPARRARYCTAPIKVFWTRNS